MDFPFRIKRGRPTFPEVGDKIYVPGNPDQGYVGGLATVTEITHPVPQYDARIHVAEHEGTFYFWYAIQRSQMQFHERYQGIAARMLTEEEILVREEANVRAMEEKKRQAEEAERQEAERWKLRRFACSNGNLLETPFAQVRWAAIIAADAMSPGGLARRWFIRGRGPSLFSIPRDLEIGDVIEIAEGGTGGFQRRYADRQNRFYGVVYAIEDDHIMVQPKPTSKEAILHANSLKYE